MYYSVLPCPKWTLACWATSHTVSTHLTPSTRTHMWSARVNKHKQFVDLCVIIQRVAAALDMLWAKRGGGEADINTAKARDDHVCVIKSTWRLTVLWEDLSHVEKSGHMRCRWPFQAGAGRGKFEIDEDHTKIGSGRVGTREYSFPQTTSKLCLCFSVCSGGHEWSWGAGNKRIHRARRWAHTRLTGTCIPAPKPVCVYESYNQGARRPSWAVLCHFRTNFYQQSRARTSSH